MIYVDNAATTKISDNVFNSMLPYLKDEYGNASAIYKLGRTSRMAIENARRQVADAIGASENEIIFTGSASEGNNTIIKMIAQSLKDKGNHIITSKIEHPSVLETCKQLEKNGFIVTYVNVDENGVIKLDELEGAITDKTILISVMFANNEIGTIEPIKEISEIAHKHNILFHTDAVQAIGNIMINVGELGIDALSLSAHKFNGPKGVGAIYIRNGIKIKSLISGGHQERGLRAGTENISGIVGLGVAISDTVNNLDKHVSHLTSLRDYYESQIEEKIPYIKINGDKDNRLPGTSNISFRFIEGEGILLNLDMKGICASSGSACTSGSLDPSHVLLAIGLPHEIAHGSLRVSFGNFNTKEEVDEIVSALVEIIDKLRNMSPLYEAFVEGSK